MAEIKLLAQGLIENQDHLSAVNQLLQLKDVNEILISVAYARKGGVIAISEALSSKKDITNLYIGINNGVTSLQAILEILKIGIHPYVIDVATSTRIYHPKIYVAFSNLSVELIIGSANLTNRGLNRNYEASSHISLDTSIESDNEYITTLKNAFCELEKRFPDNVIKISTVEEAEQLLQDGLLEDESIVKPSESDKIKTSNNGTKLRKSMPFTATKSTKTTSSPKPKTTLTTPSEELLVWESKELTERDLNIPTGSNTNPTGSMYFKKGLTENIDQRHYFRDSVFSSLSWQHDSLPSKQHLERAIADFEIVIDDESYGVYSLKLTHNSKTDTATYEQNNAMTQIHWGDAKKIIAKPELLGKQVRLYQREDDSFRLDIS